MKSIVIVNQASNYLTIDIVNAFTNIAKNVDLITGSIHIQGNELNKNVKVRKIIKWQERPIIKKLISYLLGTIQLYFYLIIYYRKYKVLFISLPPWAYLLNLILPNKCYSLIWDVYPDVFKITGMLEDNVVYKLWSFLNKRSFKKMQKILTIGTSTAELLNNYTNVEKIKITPIWSIFSIEDKINYDNNIFIKKNKLQSKFIVQYSGNIGLTHRVEYVIELAEKLREEEKILFQIIGRGPRLDIIKKQVKERDLPNCNFLPFQSDEMFPHSLSAADIGVVILDDTVSKGSVPSKSYNLMAFGIPSLYIASEDSELFEYSLKYKHVECFTKDKLDSAAQYIKKIMYDKKEYDFYSTNALSAAKKFTKKNAEQIVLEILN